MPYLIALIVIGAAGWLGLRRLKKRRARTRLLATPLSARERAVVAEQVPLATKLPPDLATRLEGKINLFLDQITFYGCDGLDVTEEMQLSIAAQACLLVANSDAWYDTLRTILIYPGAFKSRQREHQGYVVTERDSIRLGESWRRGPVVLSWAHSEQGALNAKDGRNVVLHEFAHQLDALSGHTDGAPVLNKGQSFADWEHAMVKAFRRHAGKVERHHRTLLDSYGAKTHGEFFAVAIEVFFEKPAALKKEEPELYAQLSKLLSLDPVHWS